MIAQDVLIVLRPGILPPPLLHEQCCVAFHQSTNGRTALLIAETVGIHAQGIDMEMLIGQGMIEFMREHKALHAPEACADDKQLLQPRDVEAADVVRQAIHGVL
jgi:hypothetical protein